MSWFTGAAMGLGSVVDMAGTISSIVAQHKQIELMKQANQIQSEWVHKQEALAIRGQDLTRELSIHGPALRMQSLVDAGYNPVDARRMLGSTETVQYGLMERPVLQRSVITGISETKHLQSVQQALNTFKNGTSIGTKPAPTGFGNPNYQSRPPHVNLGHNPPVTNL